MRGVESDHTLFPLVVDREPFEDYPLSLSPKLELEARYVERASCSRYHGLNATTSRSPSAWTLQPSVFRSPQRKVLRVQRFQVGEFPVGHVEGI